MSVVCCSAVGGLFDALRGVVCCRREGMASLACASLRMVKCAMRGSAVQCK